MEFLNVLLVWNKQRSDTQIYLEVAVYRYLLCQRSTCMCESWSDFTLHQRRASRGNSPNNVAPLHHFSSFQSNFIRGEIRLHLTSNDAIWEAEEGGFCAMVFYLIASAWRKGEQQRGIEARQRHMWKQRSVAGSPLLLIPPCSLMMYSCSLLLFLVAHFYLASCIPFSSFSQSTPL